MSDREHWESVYASKQPDQVSWYRPHLERSLELVRATGLPPGARVVDAGGGASTLVDDLLLRGYQNLAVVDLSASALAATQARLGERAKSVDFVVGDVTTPCLPEASVDLWHDRAVFHFLTQEPARAAYVEQLARAVRPGGYVILATFGPNGPERCSGLPVVRYDASGIRAVFGDAFETLADAVEIHETPWGSAQEFLYCSLRRR